MGSDRTELGECRLTGSKVLESVRVDGGERTVVDSHLEDGSEVTGAFISTARDMDCSGKLTSARRQRC